MRSEVKGGASQVKSPVGPYLTLQTSVSEFMTTEVEKDLTSMTFFEGLPGDSLVSL